MRIHFPTHRGVRAGCRLVAAVLFLMQAPQTARGQTPPAASWECHRWDGRTCNTADLIDPSFRQILILSTAYPDASAGSFWTDFGSLIDRLSSADAGNAWSAQKREKLLYIGFFTGGGLLGSDAATFGARIVRDPRGDATLAVRPDEVHRFVDDAQTQLPWLRPLGTAVLFPGEAEAAANATPPSFSRRPYGIALLSSAHLRSGSYVATHELAHAALNFLDEYVEAGLEGASIEQLDVLTPLLVLNSSTPKVFPADLYDYKLSEILAANGPVNLARHRKVTTIRSPGLPRQRYEYEGGMFFGRGTFHDAGANLMMSLDNSRPGARDRFAFDHSPAQQQFIDAVFGEAAPRANDRLRNAGPRDGWDQAGPTVNLLLYDADKNNSFHRTQHYQVQVGWYELDAKRNLAWRSEVHQIAAEPRTIEVPTGGSDAAVEELLLIVACRGGMTELSGDLNNLDICDRDASAFLPTFAFKLPYEETTIAVRRAFTRYWWRFQTYNGAQYSGWTGWSSFYRSF